MFQSFWKQNFQFGFSSCDKMLLFSVFIYFKIKYVLVWENKILEDVPLPSSIGWTVSIVTDYGKSSCSYTCILLIMDAQYTLADIWKFVLSSIVQ